MIFQKSGQDVDWANELMELSWTYRAGRLVHVAHGTGLFERLGRGKAATAALALDLRLDETWVERLLIPLAALGLVARADRNWELTPKAAATLRSDAPLYQGHTLAHSSHVWRFWNDLGSRVRGEEGGWVYSPLGEELFRPHRDFILAMHNMAMAGRAAALADAVDLAGRRTLMDVGGGPGSYAMALCERNPGLVATVFDLAETIEIAREVIARLGMTDRVRTVVGDWDKDEFGSDNDVVLMSNILHGPDSGAEMKLAKARRSMKSGGLLIIQDFLMNAEKTGPLIPALFNVMVGAYSVTELTGLVAAAGFSSVKTLPMPDSAGTTLITAVM